MKFKAMNLTENEIRTVFVIFDELRKMKYRDLNGFLGSLTIKEMIELHRKINYADYCERNGIKFEDMTDDDFEEAAFEKARAEGYEI